MKKHTQTDEPGPYSAPLCVLLLLVTGLAVKTGAVAAATAAALGN